MTPRLAAAPSLLGLPIGEAALMTTTADATLGKMVRPKRRGFQSQSRVEAPSSLGAET